MCFPKHPSLFQQPRELTGEKMLQFAKKKICVLLCLSCFTNNKNIFCQQISKYAVVCNLVLKLFFRTGVVKQYTILPLCRFQYPPVFCIFSLKNASEIIFVFENYNYHLDTNQFCLFLSLLFFCNHAFSVAEGGGRTDILP